VVKNKSYRYSEDVKRTAEPHNSPYDGQDPPSPIFYDDIENDLKIAIQTLPEQCQRIFLMSRFEKCSHQEIANALNISVNTVKTQIRRALEKLKHILEEKMQLQEQLSDEPLIHFEKIK
jgi:RNA polymerase sigma-70 factor (ECF subfamily)